MSKGIVIGIDPSFTATGLIIAEYDTKLDIITKILSRSTIKPNKKDTDANRFFYISSQLVNDISFILKPMMPSVLLTLKVGIEKPYTSFTTTYIVNQYGVYGLCLALMQGLAGEALNLNIYAPLTIKSSFTGGVKTKKGTKAKEIMKEAFLDHPRFSYIQDRYLALIKHKDKTTTGKAGGWTDDEIDALAIAEAAVKGIPSSNGVKV